MTPKKVHCFFEQSGTFKNEFIKIGIDAVGYDIQNEYGQTDFVVDLFDEIEANFDAIFKNEPACGVFGDISQDDLIIAFFPCIYFAGVQNLLFTTNANNYNALPEHEKIKRILDRADKRNHFYKLIYKLVAICNYRKIPLIIENPYHKTSYIAGLQNFYKPTLIDKNRMTRGDYFVKPTAYWFFNCEPTMGFTSIQNDKKQKLVRKTKGGNGIHCSKERSEISPDYARNFIYDFILGKPQKITQKELF